jgi:hypothetical protein
MYQGIAPRIEMHMDDMTQPEALCSETFRHGSKE